jgi:hypothetical protein
MPPNPTRSPRNIIDSFAIGRGGELARHPVANSDEGGPFGFTFDKHGKLLVAETTANAVTRFQLSDDGTLTQIGPSVPNGQTATCWIQRVGKFHLRRQRRQLHHPLLHHRCRRQPDPAGRRGRGHQRRTDRHDHQRRLPLCPERRRRDRSTINRADDDRRAITLTVTDAGLRAVHAWQATNSAVLNLALSTLTASQRNALSRATPALDALAQAINHLADRPLLPRRPTARM